MHTLVVHSTRAHSTVASPSCPSAGLSTVLLCSAIEQLAEAERRTEWLLCRHLAELADRFQMGDSALASYADVHQLARLRFGMSVRRVRERVRVGRALRGLPQIERAFVDGSLGYAKVREVTRVAEAESDAQWLATASELPLRVLERRVAEASNEGPGDATSEPAAVRWASSKAIELRLMLPAAAWALLSRAMEGARQRSESSLSDAEALEALARDALAHQANGEDRMRCRLRIEGDADGELQVHDASGQRLEHSAMTPRGHAVDAGLSATAMKLLDVMVSGEGSHGDLLCAATGLAASVVSCGLLELQLAGRVRSGPGGYEAVGAFG